jgi:hypothetical protein
MTSDEQTDLAGFPEDWQEQGWCCRECAVMAWYGMVVALRRELHPARPASPAELEAAGQLVIPGLLP